MGKYAVKKANEQKYRKEMEQRQTVRSDRTGSMDGSVNRRLPNISDIEKQKTSDFEYE